MIAAILAIGCAASAGRTLVPPAGSAPTAITADRDAPLDRPALDAGQHRAGDDDVGRCEEGRGAGQCAEKPGQAPSRQALMEPATTMHLSSGPSNSPAVVVIAFDEQGVVASSHSHARPLCARLNALQPIVLSARDEPLSRQAHVSRWFSGLGDVSTDWAPALCGLSGYPGPRSRTDTGYLYGPKFEAANSADLRLP